MADAGAKRLKTRMVQKHGLAEEWANATTFIPLKGEIIIYTDGTGGEKSPRIKVGDGVNYVGDLPWATSNSEFTGSFQWNEF